MTPTVNGHTRRREATRAALLDVAATLFSSQGYAQTSMQDLARNGPVTMAAIYAHFKNKADLLVETINDRIDTDLEASEQGEGRSRDHVERLTQAALNLNDRRVLRSLLVQAAGAAQTDDDMRTRLRVAQNERVERWIAGYEAARGRLGIDPQVDVPTAVLFTWATELGLGVLESFGMEPPSPAAWADIQRRLAESWQIKE